MSSHREMGEDGVGAPAPRNAPRENKNPTPLTNSTEEEALNRIRLKVERLSYLPDSASVEILIGDLRKLWASQDHAHTASGVLDNVRPEIRDEVACALELAGVSK